MTNETFYQRLSEKLADLPDDPAFDTEGVWARIEAPRRRVLGAWLWPTSLAASVLLLGGIWIFVGKPTARTTEPVAVVNLRSSRSTSPRPEAASAPTSAVAERSTPGRPLAKAAIAKFPPRSVASPTTTGEAPPFMSSEVPPVLPNPEPLILPFEVAATKPAPPPEVAEIPGTVVLTIPVPGEEVEPTRKPFVARLFKQWKRYNRGETVDWEDLGLKPLNLAKARVDSTRLAPRLPN